MKIFRELRPLLVSAVVAIACAGVKEPSDVASGPAAKRDTVMIDSVPTCQTCSIAVVDSVAIGTEKDALIPVRLPEFLRDGRGNYYLTFHFWGNQPILKYDSAGRYVQRIGGYGQGPGEYRMTNAAFIGRADSLMVFEAGGAIGQVFSPAGKYVRRADVRGGTPFALSADTVPHILVLKREDSRAGTTNQFVLRFAQHAQVVDSFAVFAVATGRVRNISSGKERWTSPEVLRSSAFSGPDGSTWTLSQTNYRIEQHDKNGVPRKLFGVRVAGELPPIMNEADMRAAETARRFVAAEPFVRSPNSRRYLRTARWIDVDSTGLLWIGRQVGAPSWDTINTKGQRLSPDEAPEEETIPREIEDRRYHTIIEVIDPAAGQMLARIELPFQATRVAPGFVGRVLADEQGFFRPSVYRLQFKRQ